MKTRILLLLGLTFAAVGGCDGENHGHHHGPAPATSPAAPPAVTNRIALPENVRQNLGVTFARAESRRVAATLRVPGRFELLPSARREYRSVLPAHVELLVRQYEAVKPGQVLARLQSPEWRRIQHEAIEAEGESGRRGAVDSRRDKVRTKKPPPGGGRRALAQANARRAELERKLRRREQVARLARRCVGKVKSPEAREHFTSKLNTPARLLAFRGETGRAGPHDRPAGAGGGAPAATINAIELPPHSRRRRIAGRPNAGVTRRPSSSRC